MAKQMTPEEIEDYMKISNAMAEEKRKSEVNRGKIHMFAGAFWFLLGGAITIMSFLSPGGTFIIAIGAIVVGIVEFVIGFRKWSENRI